LFLIVGFLVLGVLLMGFSSFFVFLLGRKTGKQSMGVTATSYYISRPQAGTERRFLNHESIGTWEFLFSSFFYTLQEHESAPPFCLIGPFGIFSFLESRYPSSPGLLLLYNDLVFTVLDVVISCLFET